MGERIVLDQEKCIKCWNTISIGGANSNRNRRGSMSIHVMVKGSGSRCVPLSFEPCDAEPCMMACPAQALKRDSETGMMIWVKMACIGCRLCLRACPRGAITLLGGRKPAGNSRLFGTVIE